jgi:predicted  nucleic acid-binding Zn-ribbon protein
VALSDWLTPTASAVGASLVAWIGYRQSVRVERGKIESGAYERAKKIYEDSINELEDRVQRLRSDLEEISADRRSLRDQVDQLQRLVTRMRRQIMLAGIELPDPDHAQEGPP